MWTIILCVANREDRQFFGRNIHNFWTTKRITEWFLKMQWKKDGLNWRFIMFYRMFSISVCVSSAFQGAVYGNERKLYLLIIRWVSHVHLHGCTTIYVDKHTAHRAHKQTHTYSYTAKTTLEQQQQQQQQWAYRVVALFNHVPVCVAHVIERNRDESPRRSERRTHTIPQTSKRDALTTSPNWWKECRTVWLYYSRRTNEQNVQQNKKKRRKKSSHWEYRAIDASVSPYILFKPFLQSLNDNQLS